MFSSKDRNKPNGTGPTPAKDLPKASSKNAVPSIISTDLKITGDMVSDGEIQIDGAVDGDIAATSLTIGEHARINGSVSGDKVKVCGTVVGQVRGKSVTLAHTAKVTGDVVHETLGIEPGAYIDGQCKRMDGAGPILSAIAGQNGKTAASGGMGDEGPDFKKAYAS